MIDEKKLIRYIKEEINPYGKPFEGTVFEFGCKVMEHIENMDKVGEWIPCSERLPEDNKMSEYYDSVIVTLDSGRVVSGCYVNSYEEWWVDAEDGEKCSINATGRVIAWQPLPKPYQAGDT